MTDEQIEKVAQEYVRNNHAVNPYNIIATRESFKDGIVYALSHQWISVEERLPEDDTMVTAHSPNGRIDVLKYHDGEFIDELHQAHCVDYFIPIPQLNPEKQSI